MRPDRQAVGDGFEPRHAEQYNPNLIACATKFRERLGRHELLGAARQFRGGEFIGHTSKDLAYFVLRLLARVREEEVDDWVLADDRVSRYQRQEAQQRATSLLEELLVRWRKENEFVRCFW